jgi:protein-L-isoaspartate(D-aspartate) O-methyltransferase
MRGLTAAIALFLISQAFGCACFKAGGKKVEYEKDKFEKLRKEMVERQIKARGVKDPNVIAAMLKVPRHMFIDPSLWNEAYEDHPVPIGEGQTISQPYIVALMTELLSLKRGEKVLEIGTGSGYQAAILAEITDQDKVFTIEINEKLAKKAMKRLKDLGYDKINVMIGDGYKGWPENAPFDAIIVTAAPSHIPQPLLDQLAEGGRMVIPVGETFQELLLITKRNGKIEKKVVTSVLFVPLIKESGERY